MRQGAFKGSQRPKRKHVLGLELPRELELDLQAYCEAMDDSPKSTVIRNALQGYIQSQLAANEGIRSKYQTIRSALNEKEPVLVPLHPVGPHKRQENSA